jgi:hypothetical protein
VPTAESTACIRTPIVACGEVCLTDAVCSGRFEGGGAKLQAAELDPTGEWTAMEFLTAKTQQPDSEEFRRATRLLNAGWFPQGGEEGVVRRKHGYMRNTQVSASIWQAMFTILSLRRPVHQAA